MTYQKDELGADVTEESEQMSDEEAAEATEIRAEIEETRIEMGGTLSELGDRLDPGQLMNEAKDTVRDATIGRVEDTARGISDMVMETIKQNPIPAAMAGAGLALLWMNRSQGNGTTYRRQYDGSGYYTGYERQDGIGDKVGSVTSTVGESVSGATDRVGHAVERAGENIGQTAGQLGQNVGQTVDQVGSQLDRIMQANPLAMAAVAAGAGAIVGTLAPATAPERDVMGEASRQVGIAVRDAVDEASLEAEKALDETEATVGGRS